MTIPFNESGETLSVLMLEISDLKDWETESISLLQFCKSNILTNY